MRGREFLISMFRLSTSVNIYTIKSSYSMVRWRYQPMLETISLFVRTRSSLHNFLHFGMKLIDISLGSRLALSSPLSPSTLTFTLTHTRSNLRLATKALSTRKLITLKPVTSSKQTPRLERPDWNFFFKFNWRIFQTVNLSLQVIS